MTMEGRPIAKHGGGRGRGMDMSMGGAHLLRIGWPLPHRCMELHDGALLPAHGGGTGRQGQADSSRMVGQTDQMCGEEGLQVDCLTSQSMDRPFADLLNPALHPVVGYDLLDPLRLVSIIVAVFHVIERYYNDISPSAACRRRAPVCNVYG